MNPEPQPHPTCPPHIVGQAWAGAEQAWQHLTRIRAIRERARERCADWPAADRYRLQEHLKRREASANDWYTASQTAFRQVAAGRFTAGGRA